MEYVKICLQRVEEAARLAGEAIEAGKYDAAKSFMFDMETWSKVAKSDFRRAVK